MDDIASGGPETECGRRCAMNTAATGEVGAVEIVGFVGGQALRRRINSVAAPAPIALLQTLLREGHGPVAAARRGCRLECGSRLR